MGRVLIASDNESPLLAELFNVPKLNVKGFLDYKTLLLQFSMCDSNLDVLSSLFIEQRGC